MTTVEGGFVSTDDTELYELMRAKRSHGMARECSPEVFEQHKNQTGVGITKGWASRTTNVEDIILGKRKVPRKWNQSTVKEELIKKGYWLEECHNCGYNEKNLATGKVCLGIDFKDGDSKNWLDGNIRLLCAICYYSFNGYFPSAKKFCK